jgi:signal transduction histidine kinase
MDDRTAEKRELSRFLHDTVAQDLVKLAFFAHELPDEAVNAPPPGGIDVQAARLLIDRCCSDIRTVSLMLTPIVQPGVRLCAAIEYYLRCFREETGMSVIGDLDPLPPLSKEVELLFCTIMQTWLARTIRFDRSASVAVRLRERGHAASLELETRLGARPVAPDCFQEDWSVVRERVAALGGEFAIVPDSESVHCKVLVPTF